MDERQILGIAIAVIVLAGVGVAIASGGSMARRIGRGLAVCAVLLLILFLAMPTMR